MHREYLADGVALERLSTDYEPDLTMQSKYCRYFLWAL
jgi:hypothetical protein